MAGMPRTPKATPQVTNRRKTTRDNSVPLSATEMGLWQSPKEAIRRTPFKKPAMQRVSPSRSPSPAPSPRAGRGATRCTRALPTVLALIVGVAALTIATGDVTQRAAWQLPPLGEVRLVDRVAEIDTSKLMSGRDGGRAGVMYENGDKDTVASGCARDLLNKWTRAVLRNASRDVDHVRRVRESVAVPPGDCLRLGDDFLQVRDARFEAFSKTGPAGAMAAKVMNAQADGVGATLLHEVVVGCTGGLNGGSDAPEPAAEKDGVVTIWWALGDDSDTSKGAAWLPSTAAGQPSQLLEMASGDAVLVRGRGLSDLSVGPTAAGAWSSTTTVFWWYGMTLAPLPTGYRREQRILNAGLSAASATVDGAVTSVTVPADAAAAAAASAESTAALTPMLTPWPVASKTDRPYTAQGYTNIALPLIQQMDSDAADPTTQTMRQMEAMAATIAAKKSEILSSDVMTDLVARKSEMVTQGSRIVGDAGERLAEIATRRALEAQEVLGEKTASATEWVSTDPLRTFVKDNVPQLGLQ